ncbi:MAG TPA: hypothetical protein PLP48_03675 [Acholeplasmataceae bacterium]|nr:hypothetical protein [Acholeplasmataceae bacterium]
MKKLIAFFFVALLALSLVACKEREYPVDGVFLGYEVSVSRNAPQVTYVTVTIEDGEIVEYNIDVRQGTRTNTGTTEAPNYTFAWNAKTKKELGDDYGMKESSAIGKEWYEQAAAIEAFWLENGVEAMTKNAETNAIDNITGVSIKDAYSVAALQALENAKAGKFVAIHCSGTDLYSVEMTLTDKGAIDTLKLDVLQATKSATEGTFVWKTQTKQQLGYNYGMHKNASGTTTEADYIAWLRANNKYEWFEQADMITADIIENGWSATASETVIAGVTITTTGYYAVLAKLFAFAGDSVK